MTEDPREIIESLRCGHELVTVAFLDDFTVGFACAQVFSSFCYPTSHGEITEMYVRPIAPAAKAWPPP